MNGRRSLRFYSSKPVPLEVMQNLVRYAEYLRFYSSKPVPLEVMQNLVRYAEYLRFYSIKPKLSKVCKK